MAARAFEAHRRGRCFRCLGEITRGQLIRACAGCHGEWEHASAADCRAAFRVDFARRMDEGVREGLFSRAKADAAIARDDAAVNFPDEEE